MGSISTSTASRGLDEMLELKRLLTDPFYGERMEALQEAERKAEAAKVALVGAQDVQRLEAAAKGMIEAASKTVTDARTEAERIIADGRSTARAAMAAAEATMAEAVALKARLREEHRQAMESLAEREAAVKTATAEVATARSTAVAEYAERVADLERREKAARQMEDAASAEMQEAVEVKAEFEARIEKHRSLLAAAAE